MGTLTLIPSGGLANRMRAVASAVAISSHITTVIWHRDSGLNAPFDALFLTDGLPFRLVEDIPEWRYQLLYEVPRKKNLYLSAPAWNLSRRPRLLLEKDISEAEAHEIIESSNGNLLLVTGHQFADIDGGLLRKLFRPTEKVSETMDEISHGRKPDITVQIRRTDNAHSIASSPLPLFEEAIEMEIAANPDVCIFLATDDQPTKQHLLEKYGANLFANPREASRDSLQGITDATAEMFIMASSRLIYGSFWSSYSEIASLLGEATLKVLTN